jgi:hypothetical protein
MSLKEAYHGFTDAFPTMLIGLTKFCNLRPPNVKLFDQIPHNVCVCAHHENIRLILTVLENYTALSSKFDEFVNQMTCCQSNKDCIYRRCEDCKNHLLTYKPSPDDKTILTNYQQWQSFEKRSEKVTITAAVNDIFADLESKLNSFLVHRYVKRMQAATFTKLVSECNGSSVTLQVDFSENATLIEQDEFQSAHWTHKQVTIFTAHAWLDINAKESFAIVSDNLNHTKEAVYTFMTHLFNQLATENPRIKSVNVFSDGASSQFKQRYLFSNLHAWENEFGLQLVWHFFATSHGKGAVDGIGGTLKRSVWRVVRAGTNSPVDAASYAEIAIKRNPIINVVFIPTEEVKSQADKKIAQWDVALGIPNTQKLHALEHTVLPN